MWHAGSHSFLTAGPPLHAANTVLLLVLAFLVSVVVTALSIRYHRLHMHLSADHMDKPQAFHARPTARIGGLAIAVGLGAGFLGAAWLGRADAALTLNLGLALLPAFLAGFVEDLTKEVSPKWRLLLTAAAGVWAVWALGATVPRLGLEWLDRWWGQWPWLGWALAVAAIAGLPHAVNLIDGYNGLMGMVCLLMLAALGYVGFQVQDREYMLLVGIAAGAVGGFLLFNYPRGLIFAGDGGAYLMGALIALLTIVLVQRHPLVSPWFALLVVAYPVCETLFSVYRKLVRGQSPGMADALHIHQLIYRRIVVGIVGRGNEREILRGNSKTSPYLWAMALLTVFPAMIFFSDTVALIGCLTIFVAVYVWLYLRLVRFRTPRFLRPRR
jgi:UDP-N-acetylmuramyl pentapeptide phosphotransferase/UDP-N-acetylglucosamine-1-phosphate transferase